VSSAPSAPGLATSLIPSPPSYTSPGQFQPINTGNIASTLYSGLTGPTQESYPSAYTLANNAEYADSALPASLSILDNSGPGGLTNTGAGNQISGQQAYTDAFYNNNLAPGIASLQQNLYNNGMLNSSAGGAELGTDLAQSQAQATLQGQQYYTTALNNFLNTRQSFFGGEGAFATNSAGGQLQAAQNNNQNTLSFDQIMAGLNTTLAGYQAQNPALQNAFNLQNSQYQNQFNSNVYGTQGNIFNTGQQGLNSQFGTQGQIYGSQLQANPIKGI
jgi:hypothetical protein